MFKFCGIIGISKTEFFKFPGTERVKQNPNKKKKKKGKEKIKTTQNLLGL